MSTFVPTVVVDRSTLFRAGLQQLLGESIYRIVASVPGFDGLQRLKLPRSRVALFILSLEEFSPKSAERMRELKGRHANSRIVLMGEAFSTPQIHSAIRSGADACLLKTVTPTELIQALDLIMLGESVFSAGLRLLSDEAPVDNGEGMAVDLVNRRETSGREQLSKRELQILQCLMQGESNKAIALRFCLTEMTVKAHMKAVLRKIGAANRTQAAIWAHQNDVQSPLDKKH